MKRYIALVGEYHRNNNNRGDVLYYTWLKSEGEAFIINYSIAKELGMSREEYENEMQKFGETIRPENCVDLYFLEHESAKKFAKYIIDNIILLITLKNLQGNAK